MAGRKSSPARRKGRARSANWWCWSPRERAHGSCTVTRSEVLRVDAPHFLGHIISHLVLDPRDGRTLLAGRKTVTSARRCFAPPTWAQLEGSRAPARVRESAAGREGRSVDHTFWLTPAHCQRAGRVVRGHVAAGIVPFR